MYVPSPEEVEAEGREGDAGEGVAVEEDEEGASVGGPFAGSFVLWVSVRLWIKYKR